MDSTTQSAKKIEMAADFDEEDDAKALDAEIDDLELVYKKKHLCNNYTPLTIISAL